MHARGSHGSRDGFVELGVPKLGLLAIPLGTDDVVVDVEEAAARATTEPFSRAGEKDVTTFFFVVVAGANGFRVSPVPV